MKQARFTDSDRYPRPYVTAEQSRREGYLTDRFRIVRDDQEKAAAETRSKVAQMKARK